ncbi:DUF262 domain-containing protein [Bifidobacterium catenulatum]|uniref:DUF262 domain-containing protein n=1 Tax=Bifidobacterium catenulatum TaxID=1686 RepID=UPI0025510D7B|nr:DUF262 domain-containing protein [Bifidobacterium catenulatum]MDK9933668.1 DUF262 domain-containing protein [Bifidobacterium catenulatum]
MPIDNSHIRAQLGEQRRKVDFDNYDVTVDELVRRVSEKRIEISPSYQRQFRWDQNRQSELIESLLLGIPVPNLFMATNSNGDSGVQWEVVDGLQRTLTLLAFVGSDEQRNSAKIDKLVLNGLEKLPLLNGLTYSQLPMDVAQSLLDRPVKVTVLNDKSDKRVRFDLFERLNTGGITLTAQEIRECVYRGPFMDLLQTLSEEPDFRKVVKVPKAKEKDGTLQEYVLRFFAFHDNYQQFDHSVRDFLNSYASKESDSSDFSGKEKLFTQTFAFLAKCFPQGLKRSRSTTPVNFFEGVAVGAALALEKKPNLRPNDEQNWIDDPDFTNAIVGATNSLPKVRRRIEYARNGFLHA